MGRVLGFRAEQVDLDAGTGRSQLDEWEDIRLFGRAVPPADHAFPALDDTGVPGPLRARAWLHVHCAMCHLPGGTAPTAGLDLRWATDLGDTGTLFALPAAGDLGLADPRILVPGDPSRSVLWERIRREDAFQMPPLGREVPDPTGLDLVEQWVMAPR